MKIKKELLISLGLGLLISILALAFFTQPCTASPLDSISQFCGRHGFPVAVTYVGDFPGLSPELIVSLLANTAIYASIIFAVIYLVGKIKK